MVAAFTVKLSQLASVHNCTCSSDVVSLLSTAAFNSQLTCLSTFSRAHLNQALSLVFTTHTTFKIVGCFSLLQARDWLPVHSSLVMVANFAVLTNAALSGERPQNFHSVMSVLHCGVLYLGLQMTPAAAVRSVSSPLQQCSPSRVTEGLV